jgi:hypothetical protein
MTEGWVHANMAGLGDDLHGKSGSTQPGLQRRLITDNQNPRHHARQRGQGVERHGPGEPSSQRIGYAEPRLCVLSWFEGDHCGSA